MLLLSKSFLIRKGENLDSLTEVMRSEIGLDAYLIKDMQAESINPDSTRLTIYYQKYSPNIIGNILPKKAGLYTSGVAGNNFYANVLLDNQIDPSSLVSGAVYIDGTAISSAHITEDLNSNHYSFRINLSGSTASGFHDIRFDSSTIKRIDGREFDYSPVAGYVIHDQSSSHLGDTLQPYRDRIRGLVKADIVRTTKGINVQSIISEILKEKNIESSSLLGIAQAKSSENVVDIIYLYVSALEPIIVDGFPLNNTYLPDTSPPSKITFVYNIEVDDSYLTQNNYFTIYSGYDQYSTVNSSDVSVLSDKKTVVIDCTSYINSPGAYSIVSNTGLKSFSTIIKSKPEHWNIYIDSYVAGTSVSVSGSQTFSGLTGVSTNSGVTGYISNDTIFLSLESNFYTGLTGHVGKTYTLLSVFTGHTGSSDPFTQYILANGTRGFTATISGVTPVASGDLATKGYVDSIVISSSSGAPSDSSYITWQPEALLSNEKVLSGQSGIYVDLTSNPVTVNATFYSAFTGHTGSTSDVHTTYIVKTPSTTARNTITSQLDVTALTIAPYVDQTVDLLVIKDTGGTKTIWVDSTGFINTSKTPTTSNNIVNKSYVDTATGTLRGLSYITWQAESLLSSEKTLTGQSGIDINLSTSPVTISSNFYGSFTGHTGDSTIHYTQAAISISSSQVSNFNSSVNALIAPLSGNFTGHTGNYNNPHQVTTAQIGAATLAQFTGYTGSVGDLSRYVLVDASRGFTAPISGQDPVQSYQLATKNYVDFVLPVDLTTEPIVTYSTPTDLINYRTITGASGVVIDYSQAAQARISLSGNMYSNVTGHTGDSTIHFTQASISITSSQISNFSSSVLALVSPLSGDFTGYTGQVGDLSRYVFRDGSRGFTAVVSGITPTVAAHLATKGYVDSIITPAPPENLLVFTSTGSSGGNYTLSGQDGIYLYTGITGYLVIGNTGVGLAVDYRQVTGDIVPSINQTYALGSSSNRFSQLYVSGVTVSGGFITGVQNPTSALHAANKFYVDTADTYLSGVLTGHTGNLSNPHQVTASQIGAPTIDQFTGFTGSVGDLSKYVLTDGTRGFTATVSGITPTQSYHLATKSYVDSVIPQDISDEPFITYSTPTLLSSYRALAGLSGVSIDLTQASQAIVSLSGWLYTGITGHIGDSTLHYTQSQISITSSQISNFNISVNSLIAGVSGDFTGHTGNLSNPHQVTASQVGAPTTAQFTGHTGDSTIHYTQSAISITSSQVSDFSESVDDRVAVLITGATGIKTDYNDAANTLTVYVSGLSHSNLINLTTTDDHSQYIYRYPSSSSRNTITPVDDYTALTISSTPEGGVSDIFVITDSVLAKKIWSDATGRLNCNVSPTTQYNLINLSYLTGNYTTISSFTGYTGNVGTLSNYILKDGSRAFTNTISGITPTLSAHLATKGYVDSLSVVDEPVVTYSTPSIFTTYATVTDNSGISSYVASKKLYVGLSGGLYTGLTGHLASTSLHLTTATGNAAGSNFGTGSNNIPSGTDPRFFETTYQQSVLSQKFDLWWATALNGWTTNNAGSSTCYVYSPRYDSNLTGIYDYSAVVAIDGSSAVAGTNSTCIYANNSALQLHPNRIFKIRCRLNSNTGHFQTGRIGLYGNTTSPSALSAGTGIWIEYAPSSSVYWFGYARDSAGNSSGISLGIVASGNRWYEFGINCTETKINFYEYSSSTGVLATITGTSVPSTAQEANVKYFGQVTKNNSAGANSPIIFIDYFGFTVNNTGRWTYV